jgi:subtilisin family serine protease
MVKRMIVRSLAVAAVAAFSLSLTACGGGGGSATPPAAAPTPLPSANTPAPPSGGGSQSSAACPTSASTASVAGASAQSIAMRAPVAAPAAQRYVPGMLVYSDARGTLHVENVDPAGVDREMSRLRATSGVRTVQRAQYRRVLAAANDPYYAGFGAGSPFFESSDTPGQWDMHVIGMSAAWTGKSGAPIAVIDTGVDVKHPDLSGRVTYAHCYVTFPTNASQTSGSIVTDEDGHGTNVAGIADADTNNSFGFAGAAFNAPLLAFRIFPSPPSGGCSPSSKNSQCDTTDVDEVTAINDAVAHGARVINLSLGSDGPLSNCQDSIEETAIKNAISKGVVVVAAAGNESSNHLDCPAAYPGVIAVGASAIEGSSNAEGVASYSNWVGASGPGGGGAYLVAPGGDPCPGSTSSTCDDSNNLHWIENIYSSTASTPGACTVDAAGKSGDCRILIAGTSQATPHVAGVVSLLLGLHPGMTPAQVAAALCSSATNIGNSKQGCGRLNAAGAVAAAAK